jgi:AcrR family transcriptional regulator
MRTDAEKVRTDIVRHAAEAFRSRGYEATSLDEIAAPLGITRAAVLYHFGSKAAILRALIEPYFADLDAVFDNAQVSDPPTGRQRRSLLTQIAEVMLRRRCVSVLLARDISTHAQLDTAERLAVRTRRLAQLLVGSNADGPAMVRATAAVGALTRPLATADFAFADAGETRALIDAAVAALRG